MDYTTQQQSLTATEEQEMNAFTLSPASDKVNDLNMAATIRSYINLYPNANAKSIAAMAGCDVSRVYVVRHQMKKKAKGDTVIKKAKKPTTTPKVVDMVNQPAHYLKGGIETIKFIEAKLSLEEYKGYLRGNIIKYTSRIGEKGSAAEDAGKARWYSNELERVLKRG